jgi:hypothetical protein
MSAFISINGLLLAFVTFPRFAPVFAPFRPKLDIAIDASAYLLNVAIGGGAICPRKWIM